mmetsp:Transcript_46873/g.123884  ORF Transcript_46873/g.123884 Transcript_46873/m.123884 type:complete len:854 (+) Transcript_46873:110-2671(+)
MSGMKESKRSVGFDTASVAESVRTGATRASGDSAGSWDKNPMFTMSKKYTAAQKKAIQEEQEDWGGAGSDNKSEFSSEMRRSMSTISTTLSQSKGSVELVLEVLGCGFLSFLCFGKKTGVEDDSDDSDDDKWAYGTDDVSSGGFWGAETNLQADLSEMSSSRPSKDRKSFQVTRAYLVMVRARALTKLNIVEDDVSVQNPRPRACWSRCKRCLNFQELQIQIEMRKIRAKVEPPPSRAAFSMVRTMNFEITVACLIILNCMTLAMEAMYEQDEKPMILGPLEHVFTFLFLMEWVLRIRAHSWVWLFDRMNAFDTLLVWGAGVMVTWLLVPIGLEADVLHKFASLRILRLTRLIRTVRLMPQFHDLWLLIYGITGCMRLMWWSLVVIGFVHWGFAVAVLETIVKSDTFAEDAEVQVLFGTQVSAMFTLFQIMTFDDWAKIVRPITDEMPVSNLLFVTFMMVAGILLVNVMTAVVIQRVFKSTDKEAEARKKEIARFKNITALYQAFQEMDTDNSGRVSEEEFTEILENVAFVRMMKVIDIDIDELPEIFHILNEGTGGSIAVEEFITGILRLQGPSLSRDMLKGYTRLTNINEGFTALDDKTLKQYESVDGWALNLDKNHEEFVEMQVMVCEVLTQLDTIGIRQASKKSSVVLPHMDIDFASMPVPKNELFPDQVKSTDVHRETNVALPPTMWVRKRFNQMPDNGGKARMENMRKELARRKAQRVSEVRQEMGPEWDRLEVTEVLNANEEKYLAVKLARLLDDKKALAELTRRAPGDGEQEPAITAMLPHKLTRSRHKNKAEVDAAAAATTEGGAAKNPRRVVGRATTPGGSRASGVLDPVPRAMDLPNAIPSD